MPKTCKHGDSCPYLTLPGGCKFKHPKKVVAKARKKRNKKQKAQRAAQERKAEQPQAEQPQAEQPRAAQRPQAEQPQAAQQVVVSHTWITMHKGCVDCSHEGCNKCYYRIRKKQYVTAPSQCRLPCEIACRICGAVGDAADPFCLKCGL